MQLRDIDAEGDDLLELTQNIVEATQHALYRFGGSIISISMADKGGSVLAGFGVPPLAHEDDPIRALMAGRDIVARLTKLGVDAGVGVTTGQVFAGLLGSGERATYTTLGRPVNLGSRLMQLAQDVLCDEATMLAARQRMEFEALPPRRVKGVDGPVPMFRPTMERLEVVRDQTEIVGREKELDVVADKIQTLLRAGASTQVLFEGEAGIGKSRLVDETVARAEGVGIPVLQGYASAIERDTPYYVWRDVVAEVMGLDLAADPEATRGAVLASLGEDAELAPLLNALLPLDLPQNERTSPMTGQVRADNTQALVSRILARGVADRPTMLVLEDAHWFDSASWALLVAVIRDVAPLLTVVATRPIAHPAPQEYAQLLARDDMVMVRVDSLSPEHTLQLVCQRLGVSNLPYGVGRTLTDRSGGNPFFSEELAYALRDAGHLLIDDGTCGLAPGVDLESLGLPDTVQGAIVSRVDRLTAPAQLLLKLASVVGREFPLTIVRELFPDDDDVTQLLQVLVARDLVLREGEGDGAHYLFKHALGRDAVYGLMLFAQRRAVHQQVAEWYESTQDAGAVIALLAHHWSHTDVHGKAVTWLRRAGDQAADRYANVEAARFYERALERLGDAPDAADETAITSMEQGLAVAHYALSNYERCLLFGRAALARLGRPAPKRLLLKIGGVLGQVALRLFQSRFPGKVDSAEDKARRLAAVRIYSNFFEIAFFTEQPIDALYSALRQINLAVPAGPSTELAQAYAGMAAMVGAMPMRGVSQAWSARAREVADQLDDRQGRAWAYTRSAVSEMYFGRWAVVEALTSEAMDVAEQMGDRRLREDAGCVRGLGLVYGGRYEAAAEIGGRTRGWAATSGNPQTLAWSSSIEALALGHQGRGAEALDAFSESRAWVEEVATSTERIWCHSAQAFACLVSGERQRALEWAERTLPAIDGVRPITYWTHHAPACLAEVYRAQLRDAPNDDAIRKKLLKSAKAAVAFGKIFGFGRPSGSYWAGVAAATVGNRDKAVASWRSCVEVAAELENQLELGLAHRDLAAALPKGERGHHEAEAERILTAAGAVWDLNQPPTLV